MLSGSNPAPSTLTPTNGTSKVVVTSLPTTITAGAAFTVVAKVEDGSGVVQTGYTGSVTVADPTFESLTGTTKVDAVHGIATFSGLTLTHANIITLQAQGAGISTAATATIRVTAGIAKQLVISAPTSTLVIGGELLNGAFGLEVYVTDAYNNLSSWANPISLNLSSNPGTGTLGGTLTKNAKGGDVSFTDLNLNQIGIGYQIRASSTGLQSATTSSFGVFDELVVKAIPSSVTAGSPFDVAIAVVDGNQKLQTSYAGPVSIADVGGEALSGVTTVQAMNGIASFTGLVLKHAASHLLQATATNSIQNRMGQISVVAGSPQQLSFTTVKTPGLLNGSFWAVVSIQDQFGNTTRTTSTVTISLGKNPGNATLSGTLMATTINGTAIFTNLVLDKPATGYTLTATSNGLNAAVSTPFNIEAQIRVVSAPTQAIIAGTPFSIEAKVLDANGTVQTGYLGSFTIAAPVGSVLQGATTATVVGGIAKFSGLILTKAMFTELNISGNRLFTGSVGVTVAPTIATNLVFLNLNSSVLAGQSFGFSIAVTDVFGNIVTGASGDVSLVLSSNPTGATLGGTTTIKLVNGVAIFSNLLLKNLGTGYSFKAVSGSLSATSVKFNVTK